MKLTIQEFWGKMQRGEMIPLCQHPKVVQEQFNGYCQFRGIARPSPFFYGWWVGVVSTQYPTPSLLTAHRVAQEED